MNKLQNLTLLCALAATSFASTAHAATCELRGKVTIEPMSSYYCDSSHTDCSGWFEADLDTGSRPLSNMLVMVTDPVSASEMGRAKTDANGNYSILFIKSSCTGQVWFTTSFQRLHESDPVGGARVRFSVVDAGGALNVRHTPTSLAGTTTTFNKNFPRLTVPSVDDFTKRANVYYTVNSAINQMKGWATSIDSVFMSLLVQFVPGSNPGNSSSLGKIIVNDAEYNMGLGIRHELGHQAQSVLHRFNQTGFGFSYKLGDGVDGHGDDTCEWGDPNMIESLATFFGVRSVTAGERNVWACGSNDNANMDACSEQVPLLSRNADRVRNFTTGRIWGIGDNFATGPLHCARITAGVNGCPACSGAGCTDYYQKMGFRVEINTVRYLWDIVDTSSDDDLSETTDESVNSLAALMEGMPCARSGLWGVDGTCRESRRTTEGAVVPVSEVGPPVSPMGATRDSYNQWDFGDLIPGSQAAARSKNCVNLATD